MFVLNKVLKQTKKQLIMNSYRFISIVMIITVFAFNSCTSHDSKPNDNQSSNKSQISIKTESVDPIFPLPDIPTMLTNPQEKMDYLTKHYWDLFHFDDTTYISQPDITEQAFVDYIQLLSKINYSNAESSIEIMMNKAKVNADMYNYIVSLFEKYLYYPNSPFRNDELYIPVLSNVINSEVLSNANQEIYAFQQGMILKNRIGTIATDFIYTLANGDNKNMHDLNSDYLILLFSNPNCSSCATLTHELVNSNTLKSIFALNSDTKNMLTVLSVYPDSNIQEWREALPNMPKKNWINSYDNDSQVTNKRLYDIKAIPTLYLLDRDKKVILKDTSLEEIENYFMKVR